CRGRNARHQLRIALLIAGRLVEAPRERLEISRQMRPQGRRYAVGEIVRHERRQLSADVPLQRLKRRAAQGRELLAYASQLLQYFDCMRDHAINDLAEARAARIEQRVELRRRARQRDGLAQETLLESLLRERVGERPARVESRSEQHE